jgi:ribosomal protein S18 acetylase RimI-like enzyme
MTAELSIAIAPIKFADSAAVIKLLRLTLMEDGMAPEIVTKPYVDGWISGGAPLLGAWVGTRLVGYARLERGPGHVRFGVVALSVLQRHRRHGLGEQLMRELLNEARLSGEIDEVWLSVAADNLPARALYEKLGFVDRTDPPATVFVPAMYLTMLWRPDR